MSSPSAENVLSVFAPALMRFNQPGVDDSRRSRAQALEAVAAWESALLHLVLYADEVWIPDLDRLARDVVSDLLMPRGETRITRSLHSPIEEVSRQWAGPFMQLRDRLSPLIEKNIIRTYSPNLVYLRVAEELFGEYRGFTDQEMATAWPELFVCEGILTAKQLGVPYTAVTPDEFKTIDQSMDEIQQMLKIDQRVLAGVTSLTLPGFDLAPSSLASARLDEEAFADFRLIVRSAFQSILEDLASDQFPSDVRRIERDVLNPALAALSTSLSRRKVIRDHTKEGAIDFSVGAFIGLIGVGDISAAAAAGVSNVALRAILTRLGMDDSARPASRFVYKMRLPNTPKLPTRLN
ncbi:MAG: hypothetical protein GKR90_25770 [Pseudomonadales bacterium]|nr:hypothetical protein [Pseudomonadales bacterium]